MSTKNEIIELINAEDYTNAIYLLMRMIDNTTVRNNYREWFMNKSDEETAMQLKALEFQDEYFKDMMLVDYEKDIYTHIDGNEEGLSAFESEPHISINKWRFKINPELDCDGIARNYEYLIELRPEYNDDLTLLHEIIHAFEFMLRGAGLDNYVTVRLFVELSQKIPNLLELINRDTHLDNKEHTTLFLLKSLKLDLELNLKLGTIYAYGREDLLNI